MMSILKTMRVAADPNRLRILLLLTGEELSVAEVQEILGMGQSTISTHLSQLKNAGLLENRRTGKSNNYRMIAVGDSGLLAEVLAGARREILEAEADQAAMRMVLRKRKDKMRSFFDSMAGRLGKDHVPGRSWKCLAEVLLHLLPPMEIADMGAGEGTFSLLLAERATRVIAVDNSARMIEVGRDRAARIGIANIEFRQGDMEEAPIEDASVDLVLFSQSLHHALHPERALQEAARILRLGGQIVILDLLRHRFEEARELFADEWLGFGEAEIETLLASVGFHNLQIAVVDKEGEQPQFEALLAVGSKP
jgi:ArsR family transcriptional regulator